jgi:hypothetical protein
MTPSRCSAQNMNGLSRPRMTRSDAASTELRTEVDRRTADTATKQDYDAGVLRWPNHRRTCLRVMARSSLRPPICCVLNSHGVGVGCSQLWRPRLVACGAAPRQQEEEGFRVRSTCACRVSVWAPGRGSHKVGNNLSIDCKVHSVATPLLSVARMKPSPLVLAALRAGGRNRCRRRCTHPCHRPQPQATHKLPLHPSTAQQALPHTRAVCPRLSYLQQPQELTIEGQELQLSHLTSAHAGMAVSNIAPDMLCARDVSRAPAR